MACKKINNVLKCGCAHLNEKCPLGKSVKSGTCFCDPRDNSWNCSAQTVGGLRGRYCTCQKKRYCPIGRPTLRDQCKCWRRPTTKLQDENSEKKRVIRTFGFKRCRPSVASNPNSPRLCTCRALKCYEAGRFKKGFCKCPKAGARSAKQKCNKKSGFCKCVAKWVRKFRYSGNYNFLGLIKINSKKLPSFKYEKRKIKVWTQDGKKKTEPRFILIDHHNGVYRVFIKPSINVKNRAAIRQEMAFYDPTDQNYKSIQKQIKKFVNKKK